MFYSSDVLLKDRLKSGTADQDEITAMAEAYLSSDHESENEMETEMQDGSSKPDRLLEKTEKRKYTPFKFSGKSYSFDYQQESQIVDSLRAW